MADKTILAILDPTNLGEQPVIERAAWLAQNSSAALELYICDYDADIDSGHVSTVWIRQPDAQKNLVSIHRDRLEAIAEPLRARGLSVSVDVGWDHPLGEALVRKIIARKPSLVAKDTHHHNVLKRTVLSNTDWHLIRGCPAPLLLVKPHAIGSRPKVFAAIDPLHAHDKPRQLDDSIFHHAQWLAEATGGELNVVHSFRVPLELEVPPDVAEQIEQQHREAMAEFLEAHAVLESCAHLLDGRPEQCLPEITESEDAAFIVMGAVSRRGLDKLFLGSTAERTLDRLPCDLLIVKPEGFEPSLPHSH
ncbi:universal stress protein [Candidatus Rariloculus sp.]|uniref:universal stress protein n=1 Tax=Candidatus Rariloculus sp. TaxID=3101265 RepID=UPI003D0A0743